MARQIAKRDQGLLDHGTKPRWCKQRTEPLEVLCLGLHRTGTTSMYEAMEILGYGTLYNSREALRRNLCTFVGTMLTDKYEARGPWPPRIEQFESLWGEYRAISGEVAYAFSEEIIPLYPDAKIILTVRDDEEKWFASSMNTSWYNNSHLFTRILYALDPNWVQIREYVGKMFKYFYRGDFPANGIRMYREHNAMVKRLGGDRVLVFNTKDGWGPLRPRIAISFVP
ncbi:hypothetical protein BDY17DRAFT_319975 [Neohortaea acidophila]|uniref:P-loop containing nucleoside triphosphate hydrolase protein n=1 Tax=Neohortaea acidophila TaxID=245834 RepID=A0A6A6Q4Y6_9PEZI|nr:uncharacterized protein BDY17DRAFT_319975 [Neohortaea acidophila]KAF2487430.1 hypothetical protein BDY17DRAFT_319975 [Neohortaea acidophila]